MGAVVRAPLAESCVAVTLPAPLHNYALRAQPRKSEPRRPCRRSNAGACASPKLTKIEGRSSCWAGTGDSELAARGALKELVRPLDTLTSFEQYYLCNWLIWPAFPVLVPVPAIVAEGVGLEEDRHAK